MLPSINELFKKSFALYKSNLYPILLLALIPFTMFMLISLMGEGADKPYEAISAGFGFMALLFFLASLFISVWVQLAFFYLIKDSTLAEKPGDRVKKILATAWANVWPYSWVLFLMVVMVAGGIILLIVPGIIFSIWFSFAAYVFVFEGLKGMQALKRSKLLVKGHWFAVFGRLLLFSVLAALVDMVPVIGPVVNIFVTMPLGIMYGYYLYEGLKAQKV